MAPRSRPVLDRLYERLREDENGCWLYEGYWLDRDGYASIGLGGRGSSKAKVHRLTYQDFIGPIPEGHDLDHLCKVRHCANPFHCEPVLPPENFRRSDHPHMLANKAGTCTRGHAMTPENTYVYPGNGKRECRFCRKNGLYYKATRKTASV